MKKFDLKDMKNVYEKEITLSGYPLAAEESRSEIIIVTEKGSYVLEGGQADAGGIKNYLRDYDKFMEHKDERYYLISSRDADYYVDNGQLSAVRKKLEGQNKNWSDIKKEYGLKLRWSHETDGPGIHYYLENVNDGETIDIENAEAIAYISNKQRRGKPFRSDNGVYDNYIKLFEILGIKPLMTLKGICQDKGISGNELARRTGIPRMTISDVLNHAEFSGISVEHAVRIAKALDMTVEEIYHDLYIKNDYKEEQ